MLSPAPQTSDVVGAIISAPPATTVSPIPIASPVSIRLDRTNFLLWKTLILPNLSGQNLHGHLDGTKVAPPQTIVQGTGEAAREGPNPAYHTWWLQDQRVLGMLLSSMTEDIVSQMIGRSTAAQVWTAVHAMFSAQSRASIRHIRQQLQTLKKKDLSAATYFHKMKSLADTMATIGRPLDDDELIDYILAGLGPQFDALVASLTVINTPVTLTDFYAYVLSYEATQEQHVQSGEYTSSANAAVRHNDSTKNSHSYDGGRGGGRTGGNNGGQQGQGGGRGRGGNRNGGSRYRPKCQICKIYGHEALNCRNRFNQVYQPDDYRSGNSASTSHGNNNDNHWYVDTGAADHLTSDLERLSVHERYGGKDQVQVANGTGQGHEENHSSR